ncbi:MAG: hypothetical protein LBK44_06515 [Spirochaetales bacterium]|nr:hypothetical protein [Spirochaetales bacterium]
MQILWAFRSYQPFQGCFRYVWILVGAYAPPESLAHSGATKPFLRAPRTMMLCSGESESYFLCCQDTMDIVWINVF